jgi:nitroreductase
MAKKIKPEYLNELILQRRSVFPMDYTGELVPEETILQILENARWAPTHRLTQPWRFLVFTGDGIKHLARLQADLYRKVTQAAGSFKEANYEKLLSKPLLSSHIIVVIMKRDERQAVPEVEETGAVFCAVENMYLTATAYGIGSYLSTGGITYFDEAKALFGLEADDRIIGFFHCGVPKREYPRGNRKPLSEISHWVTSAQ